jgi:hypothetical protein
MRIMFRPELACPDEHPEVDAAAEAAVNVVFDCVVACQAEGNAPQGDPRPIVLTAWATAHGLASLWLDGPLPRLHKWSASSSTLPVTVARTLGGLLEAAGRKRRR